MAETGLDRVRFAALMAPLGPFEPAPHLAVGVSGGADSLALALLAAEWARERGGRLTALTVDHHLRPEATVEAAQVGAWMSAAGIAHHILVWSGPKPDHGIQEAARTARLDLLEDWCRTEGVLDLLLAHHRDDQAETLLQRLGHGSGPDGLAAMAPVSYRRHVRLLRPLLPVPGAATRATLRTRGHPWIEDPSNRDGTYQRVRLRRLGPALAEAGVDPVGLALASTRAAERRAEAAHRRTLRLAESVTLDPRGFARVHLATLVAPPDSEARAALGRLLACIGGGPRPPRDAPLARALDRLRRALDSGTAETLCLGRCRILPDRHAPPDGPGWLVVREARHWPPPQPLTPNEELWDGRFRVVRDSALPLIDPEARVVALGRVGWCLVAETLRAVGVPVPSPADLPVAARAGLPLVVGRDGLPLAFPLGRALGGSCVVPHILYAEGLSSSRVPSGDGPGAVPYRVRFSPRMLLTEAPMRLAKTEDKPI